MKATLHRFFKRLLGLSTSQMDATLEHSSPAYGVRLSRLPFFVIHVLVYALLYLAIATVAFLFQKAGKQFSVGEMETTLVVFIFSILMLPVYVRRAHDLGWSMKYVLFYSIIPGALRLLLLVVPLLALLNPAMIQTLFKIMPVIGIIYWTLGKIQLIFVIVLAFAPGIGAHNRYGTEVGRSFTTKDMFGFALFKKRS